jgi:putative PIN family toxin of toxin-antitoxin system
VKQAPVCVIDTMIVVSGIIGKPNGSDAQILSAIETGQLSLVLSDVGLLEFAAVLERDFIQQHFPLPSRVFRVGLALGMMGNLYRPKRYDWTSLSDPKDWWLLDLAFAAEADYIVTRDKKVLLADNKLGFTALAPPQVLKFLK